MLQHRPNRMTRMMDGYRAAGASNGRPKLADADQGTGSIEFKTFADLMKSKLLAFLRPLASGRCHMM